MKALTCLALSLLIPLPAGAVLVDIPASGDTTLYQSSDGLLANGAGNFFFAGRTGQQFEPLRRGLIEFDLTSYIPAGALIASAELLLTANKGGNESTIISLYRLNRGWTEGDSIAGGNEGGGSTNILGNDATWLEATSGGPVAVEWSGPGAAGDFNLAPSASQVVGIPGATYMWSGLATDVQGWLADANSNHGWLLIGDEVAPSSAVRFVSRDNPETSQRPVLRVEFVAIPEPAALSLMAVVLAAGSRRRRP